MSTSALTIITENGSPIMTLYRWRDGSPNSHGHELAEFLTGFQIATGRVDQPGKWANGAGCLAAQLVTHFKKRCGDFYLLAPTAGDVYEWSYTIEIPFGWHGPAEDLVLQVYAYGELSSSSTLRDFAEHLREIQS
jgi:hypothetical protein